MMRRADHLRLILAVLVSASVLFAGHGPEDFVRREGIHLQRDTQRFYYMGANCFYLAYFAQDTNVATNGLSWRDMSDEVLDRCAELGISVLRVWAFNEANVQEFSAVHGDWRMQTQPGVYREQALVGLDYVLNAANDRDLHLVLTLVNNWDAYGGMMWYVTNSPTAGGDHDAFYTDVWCRQWYKDHVATLALRTNTINGRVYRDDPTIHSWQLANEPRSDSTTDVVDWVDEMAGYIRSIDTNHMISVGGEGWEPQWTLSNSSTNIDYAVMHCWPDWWWPSEDDGTMYSNAMNWVSERITTARDTLGKPIVLSEYGRLHPAWGGLALDDAFGRHGFYRGWFDAVYGSASADGPAAGMHFWMIEAADSGHDDAVGSAFPRDTTTYTLIRQQAERFNTLIMPEFTAVRHGDEGQILRWLDVVGRPVFRIEVSSDLVDWEVAARVSTNTWTDAGTTNGPRRYYRVAPEY